MTSWTLVAPLALCALLVGCSGSPAPGAVPTPSPATGDRVTIAMLLAHTAGTGDYLNSAGYLRVRDSFDTLDELIAAVDISVPAGTVPGAAYKYSNTGYLLLGVVIEKASGRDYYDY